MSIQCTLNEIKEGQQCIVKTILTRGAMRRRLLDLGIISGTRIECRQKSPYGDPVAFLIRGAVIALRNEDSVNIIVEPLFERGDAKNGINQ
ncbi:FeoA family protein [Anaeromicropila populeti]|uniref:Ferrous iron transport protein A n=1 Tax=Anaeromicropila populeti TaxID=37658 RepID=A0A1I6KQW0_9FIRM|nr:FeoA family protein [Anaeromicropila populeti]SFR93639.1 ferrous iron transport protein A [Anaeromicropila populeti]